MDVKEWLAAVVAGGVVGAALAAGFVLSRVPHPAPTPRVKASKADVGSGFIVTAICPDGWMTHFEAKDLNAYNAGPRGYVEMVNFFASATCVPNK